MLGVLMTIWSVTILPFVFRINVTLGSGLLPTGYATVKTIGFSIRFDWKAIQSDEGIAVELRYSDKTNTYKRSMQTFNQMGPRLLSVLKSAPALRQQLLGYLENTYLKTDISLGLSDAASTALACGALNALVGCFPKMRARIVPVFRSEDICFSIRCIASVRLGKLLLSAALCLHAILMQRMRQKAGGAAYGKSASD